MLEARYPELFTTIQNELFLNLAMSEAQPFEHSVLKSLTVFSRR